MSRVFVIKIRDYNKSNGEENFFNFFIDSTLFSIIKDRD